MPGIHLCHFHIDTMKKKQILFLYNRRHIAEQRRSRAARATKVLVGYSSIYDRFGLGLVYTIRTFRYLHHFCLTLVRRRRARDGKKASEGTQSEREQYEIDDALIFCLAPFFGRLDTPSFVCATGVHDGRKRLR